MFEPFGRFGPNLSKEDLAAVRRNEYLLKNLIGVSGNVSDMKLIRALPGGGTVMSFVAGGIQKSIVRAPLVEDSKVVEFPTHDPGAIPMLFSGVVVKPTPKDGKVQLEVTEVTRRRLVQYGDDKDLDGSERAPPPRELRLARFAVEHDDRVSELKPPPETPSTQYLNLRPTWYSGAMAEVVQIVGAYGITDMATLPDDPVERAVLKVPRAVVKAYTEEFGRHVLPGYTGVPPKDGKIKYDYKALSTNLVAFDAAKQPWLIEMKGSGVWAMPLPLIPVTTCKAFRTWIEEKGDEELLSILDRFGGMPSGERFPNSEHFERWRRAGAVIKVCEMGDAHKHFVYCAANGWSMNLRGNEAYSTCYDYGEDGVGFGMTFKGSFQFGAADHHGWGAPLDLVKLGFAEGEFPPIIQYAGRIIAAATQGKSDHKKMAAWFKLLHLSKGQLITRAAAQLPVDEEIDYLDNMEADPIASHAGGVSEVRRGWLYHPAKFAGQPQIKLPDPYFKQCLSHDFSIMDGGNRNFSEACDTVMWAYFIGDELKVVKYHYSKKVVGGKVDDDFEECMIVGSWTRTTTTEGVIAGNFSLTDLDDR